MTPTIIPIAPIAVVTAHFQSTGLSSFRLSAYYRPICVINTSATFPPSSYAPRSKGTILKTIYNVLKAVMIMSLK